MLQTEASASVWSMFGKRPSSEAVSLEGGVQMAASDPSHSRDLTPQLSQSCSLLQLSPLVPTLEAILSVSSSEKKPFVLF